MKKISIPLLLILMFSAFLYFFNLGVPTIWDQDEGQMLASSLEMVKTGEYFTPHLNQQVYFHKPPLYAWLTTIMFKLFGFNEFGGRFWATVFGLLGIFLTYSFAKNIYNERTALLSALIVAVSPLYIILSKMGLVDVLLAVFMTFTVYSFWLFYKNPQDKKWIYMMYLSMGLGVMTKGPLGLLVPGAAIGLFLIIDKNLAFVGKMEIIKGALLFFAIASPWFIVETIREGTYFLEMIFGQFLFAIYMSPLQQHPGPFYYYILVVLIGFLPWSGLFVSALFKKPHALLLSLFLVMLGLFSTASTKVPGYFLPAFPVMAIMTANFVDGVFEGKNKLGYYIGIILPILILGIGSFQILNVQVPSQYAQAVLYLQTLLFFTLAGFFLSFLFSFFKPQLGWTMSGFALSTIVFFIGLIAFMLPYAENFKPSYDFSQAVKEKENLCFYKTWLPPSLIFYTNRDKFPRMYYYFEDEKKLSDFLSKTHSACLIDENEYKKLKGLYKILKAKSQYAIIEKGR